MPTEAQQAIVAFLYEALLLFVRPRKLGKLVFAPFRIRLWPGKYREPDVAFMLAEHADRRHDEYWEGADLVVEVVSDDDRRRDFVTKRREYAEAGIPEYWIVDPQRACILVLRLGDDGVYEQHDHPAGSVAPSDVLAGFEVGVDDVLAAGEE